MLSQGPSSFLHILRDRFSFQTSCILPVPASSLNGQSGDWTSVTGIQWCILLEQLNPLVHSLIKRLGRLAESTDESKSVHDFPFVGGFSLEA